MKLRKTVYFKIDIILEQNWYIYCMIRFSIIRFSSVNDTKASVFSYSGFTRFSRPLAIIPQFFIINWIQLYTTYVPILMPSCCSLNKVSKSKSHDYPIVCYYLVSFVLIWLDGKKVVTFTCRSVGFWLRKNNVSNTKVQGYNVG